MAMERRQVDGADRQQGTIDTVIDLFGGFSPLATDQLPTVAGAMDATTMQLALAWLLQRSPAILCIPGTSSVAHLRENMAAGTIRLTADQLELDRIVR